MRKTFLLICIVALSAFICYKIYNIKNNNVLVYENRNDKKQLLSQTEYIKDSHNTFIICSTRTGNVPCVELKGIKQGAERWYKDGVVEYLDTYNRNVLEKSTLYYKNGHKNREDIYENKRVIRQNFYNEKTNNDLAESIMYRENETIKRFYKNNKVKKEEKYRNKRLVSRKIYNDDGIIQRLEEYGTFGNANDFDGNFNSFDDFIDDFDDSFDDGIGSTGGWI